VERGRPLRVGRLDLSGFAPVQYERYLLDALVPCRSGTGFRRIWSRLSHMPAVRGGESRKDSADEALHSCQPIVHVRTPWRGYGRVVLGAASHGADG